MQEVFTVQGRELRPDHLEFIRQLLRENPSWSRRRLSQELCKAWNWRNAKGDLKDMASRSMLLKLDSLGEICLPPRRQTPSNRMTQRSIAWVDHDTTPITASLKSLQPLKVIVVSAGSEQEALFSCLLSRHHYLGYISSVGENMKYLVLDRYDRAIACLLFGSSAWSARGRDAFIGWDKQARNQLSVPVKATWVFPLSKDFRNRLMR